MTAPGSGGQHGCKEGSEPAAPLGQLLALGSCISLPMLESQGNLCLTKPSIPRLTFFCMQFMKNYGDITNNWKEIILHRPVDLEIQAPSKATCIFTHRGGFHSVRANAEAANSTFMPQQRVWRALFQEAELQRQQAAPSDSTGMVTFQAHRNTILTESRMHRSA